MSEISLTAVEVSSRLIDRPPEFGEVLDLHRMIGIAEVRLLMANMSVKQIDRLIEKGQCPKPTFISPNRRSWRLQAWLEYLNRCEALGQHKRNYSTKKKAV